MDAQTTAVATEKKVLDPEQRQKVAYCIPGWLRDEQIRIAIQRVTGRIEKYEGPPRQDPVAIVCYGPSLSETWQELKNFKYIISCSGAHKFLIERGIIPTWHIEVDPRSHKIDLMGKPHKDVEYLLASACHPKLFDHLKDHNVKLWHVYDPSDEGIMLLPRGEWAITGGCSVGLRCLTIARFFGFTDQHIFGMDGSGGTTGLHASKHPNQPTDLHSCTYDGVEYCTTPAFLEAARQTFHELEEMHDVSPTFHGNGLVQAMSKHWVRKKPEHEPILGVNKPELISSEMKRINSVMHSQNPMYGTGSGKYADLIKKWVNELKFESVLDYGCGKGYLAKALPFPIWEYDPAIPGKDATPRPADLVTCIDVLEHIEPDRIDFVLDDLKRCTKRLAYVVIHLGAASKTLPDGRNTHLIQESDEWWRSKVEQYFNIGQAKKVLTSNTATSWDGKDHYELRLIMEPLKPARRWDVLKALIEKNGWTKGAEIGVKDGKLFLKLLDRCPLLHLTGVDIFEPRPGLEKEGGESHVDSDLPGHEKKIRETIEKCYPTRATLIKGYSVKVAPTIPDKSLDFVFIDADHRETAVRADILSWMPKVKPGGMLMGHDAQMKFPGVMTALNALCHGWMKYPDSVWGYKINA